jgi:DNA-binding FrmR family transcriptional regulator
MTAVYGYSEHKDDYLRRLRRIEGQIRGLQRMIGEIKEASDAVARLVRS